MSWLVLLLEAIRNVADVDSGLPWFSLDLLGVAIGVIAWPYVLG